jgi:hypothetical protein
MHRLGKISQPEPAKRSEFESVVGTESVHGVFGDEDLPAVTRSHHARRLMNGERHIVALIRRREPGLEADAHAHLSPCWPLLDGQRSLRCSTRGHRVSSTGERDEERVTFH